MDKILKQTIEKINSKADPVCIFLYGSRAREDYKQDSDYELGVVYSKAKDKLSRTELKEIVDDSSINAYSFLEEELSGHNIDTPLPPAIYIRELVLGAKVISGQDIFKNITAPAVSVVDVLENITFHTGLALGAVLSFRQNDLITASMEYSKSCLFGARDLLILQRGAFPLAYDEIASQATALGLKDEHKELIQNALEVRAGKKPEEAQLYENLSFLNQEVYQEARGLYKSEGDKELLNSTKRHR